MISGKPVSSDTSRTGTDAAASSRAVPPVEMISTPSSTSPRAKSTIPVLSDTDSSARSTRTSRPVSAGVDRVCDSIARDSTARPRRPPPPRPPPPRAPPPPPPRPRLRRRPPGPATGARPDHHPPGVLRIDPHRAGGDQPHRLDQQLVLERPQAGHHLRLAAGVGQLERPLQDHRSGVDALIDEVHGDPEHLHPVGERLLDRPQAGKRRQQRRVQVDHPPAEALQNRRREQLHVARQHHQLHAALGQPVGQRRVARRPLPELGRRKHPRRHPRPPGPLQRRRPGPVGGHGHDPHAVAAVDGVQQRLEVRPGARGQDADPHARTSGSGRRRPGASSLPRPPSGDRLTSPPPPDAASPAPPSATPPAPPPAPPTPPPAPAAPPSAAAASNACLPPAASVPSSG